MTITLLILLHHWCKYWKHSFETALQSRCWYFFIIDANTENTVLKQLLWFFSLYHVMQIRMVFWQINSILIYGVTVWCNSEVIVKRLDVVIQYIYTFCYLLFFVVLRKETTYCFLKYGMDLWKLNLDNWNL